MRIAYFGGAFDPPHAGHLAGARACLAAGAADRVWLAPTFIPPHKDGKQVTAFRHRLAMLKLLTAGEPDMEVTDVERRLALSPSYTIEVLRELVRRYPEHEFRLLIGGDSLRDLPDWHCGRDLAEEFEIWTYPREGTHLSAAELNRVWGPVLAEKLAARCLGGMLHPGASSRIRQELAAGEVQEGMLPRSIMEYIQVNHLYGRVE